MLSLLSVSPTVQTVRAVRDPIPNYRRANASDDDDPNDHAVDPEDVRHYDRQKVFEEVSRGSDAATGGGRSVKIVANVLELRNNEIVKQRLR